MSFVESPRLKIQFWGVRGSIATAESNKLTTGGNTPCTFLQYNNEPVVIIDAGTGLRKLGEILPSTASDPLEATILFSHFHWDHIQGFPFFTPIYSKYTRLKLISGVSSARLKQILEQQMTNPYFPVPFAALGAQLEFSEASNPFDLRSLRITPVTLNHPGAATGFRIDSPAGSLIYVSDHEHGNDKIDIQIQEKARGADLMIYDAHFTPEEYPSFKGWGHSTWLEGVKLAKGAGVRQLLLFHHSPSRTDEQIDVLEKQAAQEFPKIKVAREANEIILQQDVVAAK